MSGTSTITKKLTFRVENEIAEIIWNCAKETGTTPSAVLREVVVREFKGLKRTIDKRQGKLPL